MNCKLSHNMETRTGSGTSGQKNASASSLVASKKTGSSASNECRSNKWRTSNSKFNKILTNLERSILSQFGASASSQRSSSTATTTTSSNSSAAAKATISGNKSRPKPHPQSSLSSKPNTTKARAPVAPATLIVPGASSGSPQQSARTRNDNQRQEVTSQHQTAFPSKITSISSPIGIGARDNVTAIKRRIEQQQQQQLQHQAIAGGKATLNKYQQQIVSTLRPSQQVVNNKLSIPPPHANDEARNNSQRVLFGATIVDQPESTNSTVQNNQQQRHFQQQVSKQQPIAGSTKRDEIATKTDSPRLNSSPASSAKSLPPRLAGGQEFVQRNSGDTSKSTCRRVDRDDEESGFATYQSRRSLIANNSDKLTNSSVPNQSNNMIHFQNNHVPIGHAISYGLNNSNGGNPQQYLYSYQQLQLNQPSINTQQAVLSNQQPIPTTSSNRVPIFLKDGSLIFNAKQHQYQLQHQQPFSDMHRFYNLHSKNGHDVIAQSSNIDSNQPIYTNAPPPKPRRYQYYGTNQGAPVQIAKPGSIDANNKFMFVSQPFISGRADLHELGRSNPPHLSVPNNQNFKNLAYLSQPDGRVNQMNYELHQNNFFIQQRMNHAPPYQMTKSKSSLDASDLLRFKGESNGAAQQIQVSQQSPPNQLQQPVYGSRFDTIGRKSNLMAKDRELAQQSQQMLGNLQRSKSVSHLLPIYRQHPASGQHQEILVEPKHSGAHQGDPRLLLVSSASTTNLNLASLSDSRQCQLFAKAPSSHNLNVRCLGQSQPAYAYNDSFQQQQQQASSQQSASLAAAISRQQYLQGLGYNHRHASQMASNDSKDQRRLASNNGDDSDGGSMLSNNGPSKLIRQSAGHSVALEDGFNKPSLDDKIRHLLIGPDESCANNTSDRLNSENQNHSAIYHQSPGNNNCGNATNEFTKAAAWSTRQKQTSSSIPFEQSSKLLAANNKTQHHQRPENNGQSISLNSYDSHATAATNNCATSSFSNNQLINYSNDFELNNSIFVGDPNTSNMGNRQNRQYTVGASQINEMVSNVPEESIYKSGGGGNFTRETSRGNVKNDASSQLIVDLTTSRVLARTQTNLLSSSSSSQTASMQDSWSMNQVGLPQLPHAPSQVAPCSVQDKPKLSVETGIMKSIMEQHFQKTAIDSRGSLNHSSQAGLGGVAANRGDDLKRTAPYYYSDLKSVEQKQALLNIVQQKSLSPPPQLLSRSANQSNTRLAPRSATMHSNQAKLLSESLANRQRPTQISMTASGGAKSDLQMSTEFNSTSNIAQNIDRLFESPAGKTETNAARSMLTLNDFQEANDSTNDSSTHKNNESPGGAQFKGKNFNKSKSLENISQKSITCEPIGLIDDKTSIYENIRRSDKLLNAINSSTTCLSTSSSRAAATAKKNAMKNRQAAIVSASDESMDSILGSSLEDSIEDIIEDVKLSPTDDHLEDMSQLIRQLKENHSKLTEEYKSTLVRIRETINSRNKQGDGCESRSEKLAKRLQSLESKSRKCEVRSRNQLALIQMMEKVLQQSRSKSPVAISGRPRPMSGSSPFESKQKPNSIGLERSSASSSLSSSGELNRDNNNSISSTSSQNPSPRSASSQHSAHKESLQGLKLNLPAGDSRIIRAVVTEIDNPVPVKTPNGIMKKTSTMGAKTSDTRVTPSNGRSPLAQRTKSDKSTSDSNKQATEDPFISVEGNNDSDDSRSSLSSSLANEAYRLLQPSRDVKDEDDDKAREQLIKSRVDNSFDDDDFIEFLSTDSSMHRGSQFEASQFSVSDFNTSTSTSESSTSGACNDSLNSPAAGRAQARHNYQNGLQDSTRQQPKVGALKRLSDGTDGSTAGRADGPKNCQSDGDNNNAEDEKDHESEIKSIFNDILGNVVDVDVCHRKNLSECSPVNS